MNSYRDNISKFFIINRIQKAVADRYFCHLFEKIYILLPVFLMLFGCVYIHVYHDACFAYRYNICVFKPCILYYSLNEYHILWDRHICVPVASNRFVFINQQKKKENTK